MRAEVRVRCRRPCDGGAFTLAESVTVADRWWRRAVGLLGRTTLAPGEGVLLVPCRAVHMLGMRMALDVAMIDRAGCVVATYPCLAPGGRTRFHRDAWAALELAAGALETAGVAVGDWLTWDRPPVPTDTRATRAAHPTSKPADPRPPETVRAGEDVP